MFRITFVLSTLQLCFSRTLERGFLRPVKKVALGSDKQDTSLSNLQELVNRLDTSLRPFQKTYRTERGEATSEFQDPSAMKVWDAFQRTLDNAFNDESLKLNASMGPAREDGSVFISISSYRDPSCSATVKSAFAAADNKDKVNVGIVQQNCLKSCHTGTGWAETRRWIKSGPDPDCVQEFCSSAEGKSFCDNGQVRILRLEEAAAYGPFFARFLNAKLWHGENYFMQIDSHTKFRTGWDTSLISQLKRTPSYPKAVLSNYPPSASAEDTSPWPRAKGGEGASGLCSVTFEKAGTRDTLRLERGDWSPDSMTQHGDDPAYAAFVAAGFFFTHGSYVTDIAPDPFLPYIFMGEEIVNTMRMWTAGFDIYAPAADVVGHEYVRSEHPKFWETVNMVFDYPSMHNDLTSILLQRVENIVGFPEAQKPDQLNPANVLIRLDQYNVSSYRSRDRFLRAVGLNIAGRQQTPPSWCGGHQKSVEA